MKIRNNTNKKLVFYFSDHFKDEPISTVDLLVGERINLKDYPGENISIQED